MTASVDPLPGLESLGCSWEQGGGSYWTAPQNGGPREIAEAMRTLGARFITITATEPADSDGVIRLDYHWDFTGKVLTFTFFCHNKSIESIYDRCEAANWIERELHEYFAIDFGGRECEPLFLREGQQAGLHLREGDE